MISRHVRGRLAERFAEYWLRLHRYKLLARNFRCRYGEIDLVMLAPSKDLVFIEVRYRQHLSHGGASASVDTIKQAKLQRSAASYLSRHRQHNLLRCRFDVISFEFLHMHWIQQAFDVEGLSTPH